MNKLNSTIEKKIFIFEKINFEELTCIKGKNDRQVFFHDSKPIVYKIFKEGWEFADKTEQGINCSFYDNLLVPNFLGLIKNKRNSNCGYVCKRFMESQQLVNYTKKNNVKTILKQFIRRDTSIKDLLMPQYKPSNKYLVKLLFNIFSRALKTNVIFTELNPIHIWTDNKGYYLFDLDSLRELDWLFCQNRNDPKFMIKIINCSNFNRGLRELIELHNYDFPFKITQTDAIIPFWQSFIQINKLDIDSLNITSNLITT